VQRRSANVIRYYNALVFFASVNNPCVYEFLGSWFSNVDSTHQERRVVLSSMFRYFSLCSLI